jgi:hypothetical protein
VWAFTQLFPSLVNNVGQKVEWKEPPSGGNWMAG